MDALNSKWRAKLIGVSTDRENPMTGQNSGVVITLYKNEEILREEIDAQIAFTDLYTAWDSVTDRFCRQRSFCGGLASVFANTTSVEADFSILKWEVDANRADLTHLSIEGIF